MRTSKLIAILAGYTGWSLEYIGQLQYSQLIYLVNEITCQRQKDTYRIELFIGQLISLWAKGNPSPEQIVGKGPQEQKETINMASKPAPQVVVLGDGKEYTLPVIDANIMETVEEHFNMEWQNIFAKLRAKHMKVLLHSMLRTQNPNISIEEVGALLTVDAQVVFGKALGKLA